jgi:hypothetical protein
MGRPGSALDNAVIESWHSTGEFKLGRVEQFADKAAARAGVAAWIEDYNRERRHSALGMISRWIASGPWREGRRMTAAGRCAARGREGRRLRRRSSPGAPRRLRGRSSGLQGAAHRAARDSPAGCLGPGDLGGPRRQEERSGPGPAPARRAARGPAVVGGGRGYPDASEQVNWRSTVRRRRKITRIRYEEVSTLSGESRTTT